MPFASARQMRGAFGGHLGPTMKAKASQWAAETPRPGALPERAAGTGKPTPKMRRAAMLKQMKGH